MTTFCFLVSKKLFFNQNRKYISFSFFLPIPNEIVLCCCHQYYKKTLHFNIETNFENEVLERVWVYCLHVDITNPLTPQPK
jgi:hypothetical protein